jgi:hypothetical protein
MDERRVLKILNKVEMDGLELGQNLISRYEYEERRRKHLKNIRNQYISFFLMLVGENEGDVDDETCVEAWHRYGRNEVRDTLRDHLDEWEYLMGEEEL